MSIQHNYQPQCYDYDKIPNDGLCAQIEKENKIEQVKNNIEEHMYFLAQQIGSRNIENIDSYKKLNQAASYIKKVLHDIGYKINIQSFEAKYSSMLYKVENIEAIIEGTTRKDQSIIIGAHYDTVNISPGADDNGSGIAALLEMARYLFNTTNEKTIKFVAFPNEEKPYSLDPETKKEFSNNMGSVVYAKYAKENHENIQGMISLESIGYYSNKPDSQKYPFSWLKWLYPDTGNFLGFISNVESFGFWWDASSAFKEHSLFPTASMVVPEFLVPGIGRSDHKSFWIEGYPAIMITDTADNRNPYYHTKYDTINTIDYDATAEVVIGLSEMIPELAN